MSNPFDLVPEMEQGAKGSIFREAAQEASETIFEEAKDLLGSAMSLKSQAQMARKAGNYSWMMKIQSYALQVLDLVFNFLKKAIVIAAAKFVLEMCALIINQIMDSLGKRGNSKIDISTPNVHYVPRGQMAPGSTQPTVERNTGYVNPFADVFRGASPF